MFDKAMNALEECKASPKTEDAKDAFAKHIAHQLRYLPERQRFFLHFKIQELIFNCQVHQHEQQPLQRNYNRNTPHFSSPTSLEPPSPQFNPQMNMGYINEGRLLANAGESFSNNSGLTQMLNNSFNH